MRARDERGTGGLLSAVVVVVGLLVALLLLGVDLTDELAGLVRWLAGEAETLVDTVQGWVEDEGGRGR